MNTEKMIPIDYVKQFTPLVVGDELFYKDGGYKFTLKSKVNAALYNNNDDTVDKYYSLVSFADRENTGKQPVADDVVVDDNHTRTARASALLWYVSCGIQIKTWKPNHAAMLAKFKEQGANTMNEQEHKAKSHEVALMTNALDDNPDEQVPVLSEDWVIDHLTDKPVFTQEMADAGELPPVGLLVQIRRDFGDDNEFYNGSLIAEKNGVVWFADDKYGGCLHSLNEITFKPIDNRTEHEKALDWISEYNSIPKMMLCDIKDGKCPWLKWVGE